MFEKNNKISHESDKFLWAVFVIIAVSITFSILIEISKKNPNVFSYKPSGLSASSGNIDVNNEDDDLDVNVMIAPTN